jgi:hypothetical protein
VYDTARTYIERRACEWDLNLTVLYGINNHDRGSKCDFGILLKSQFEQDVSDTSGSFLHPVAGVHLMLSFAKERARSQVDAASECLKVRQAFRTLS